MNGTDNSRANGFMELFDGMQAWYLDKKDDIFIDTKITSLLGECLNIQEEFSSRRSIEFTSSGNLIQTIKVSDDLEYQIYSDTPNQKSPSVDYKWYTRKLNEYFSKYAEFKAYLSQRKLYFDSMK